MLVFRRSIRRYKRSACFDQDTYSKCKKDAMLFCTATLAITLILPSLFSSEVMAIACGDICKDAQCKKITECPPGQTLKPAGYCLCCLKCVTILQMNQKCPGLTFLMGVPPSLQECAEGLSCINGVCRPSISMTTRF